MRTRRATGAGTAAALALLVAGCAPDPQGFHDRLLAGYLADGRLRTEPAPPDAPFGNEDLVRNFERVAFHTEFAPGAVAGGALVEAPTEAPLFRWAGPVRWRIEGDGATEADREAMLRLAARLSELTGLIFEEAEDEPNMAILIASAPLRESFAHMLEASGAAPRMRIAGAWARENRFPCVGQIGVAGAGADRSTRSIVLIKAETRGLLRESCLHEEVTQSLGLLNDDPRARPSIFNDDQEFALLTEHDAYLLRILYDPRLSHGMTAAEGMPIVRRIVDEIGPGPRP